MTRMRNSMFAGNNLQNAVQNHIDTVAMGVQLKSSVHDRLSSSCCTAFEPSNSQVRAMLLLVP